MLAALLLIAAFFHGPRRDFSSGIAINSIQLAMIYSFIISLLKMFDGKGNTTFINDEGRRVDYFYSKEENAISPTEL